MGLILVALFLCCLPYILKNDDAELKQNDTDA